MKDRIEYMCKRNEEDQIQLTFIDNNHNTSVILSAYNDDISRLITTLVIFMQGEKTSGN